MRKCSRSPSSMISNKRSIFGCAPGRFLASWYAQQKLQDHVPPLRHLEFQKSVPNIDRPLASLACPAGYRRLQPPHPRQLPIRYALGLRWKASVTSCQKTKSLDGSSEHLIGVKFRKNLQFFLPNSITKNCFWPIEPAIHMRLTRSSSTSDASRTLNAHKTRRSCSPRPCASQVRRTMGMLYLLVRC